MAEIISLSLVRADTSNQLDTDEDCKPSYSACDTEVHVESDKHRFTGKVCNRMCKVPSPVLP